MCGIAGVINYKQDPRIIINKLNQSIKHRGPDDKGEYIDKRNNIFLTMTRLSIIGLDEGSQPKISKNKNVIIFFNGEIFNYKDLNKTYFKNKEIKSDTEIILNMYLLFGLKMLDYLNGMFAISIFDKRKKKLFLIRDRFGIKPLYYHNNKSFIFSSEINSIQQLNNQLQINQESVSDYLSLGVTGEKETIYKEVNKLGPGEFAVYDLTYKTFKIKRWYKFKIRKIKTRNFQDAVDFTSERIKKSVNLWAVSDVPISFLLSGGFDSSILASIYNKSTSEKINTFSLGFLNKKYEKWNEISISNSLVKKINSNHKNIFLNVDNLNDDLDKMILSLGEPYGGGLPSWYIFKEISKKSKVAISGTGGDELFGNYNRYYNMKNFFNKKSHFFNKNVFKEGYFFNRNYKATDSWKSEYLNFKFKKNKIINEYFSKVKKYKFKNLQKQISFLDIETQLCNEFLYITDKFSMAHSLEVRTPYLDHELVESIYGLAEKYRTSNQVYKPLLREIGKKYLTKDYYSFAKHGFSLPLSLWMRGKLRQRVLGSIGENNLKKIGIINPKFYEDYVFKMLKGDNSNIQLIWNVFMLHEWIKLHA